MIIGHKQKVYQRPVPAVQFDKFLKIRSEKQSIIQSSSEHIIEKVQGFQELLKLTKTGASISSQQTHKKNLSAQLKNKTESSKTIGGYYSVVNGNEINKFQDLQSQEAQMKKLNKMVTGMTEWEDIKGKDSVHLLGKGNYPKTSHEKKRSSILPYKEKAQQQAIRERKQLAYSSCDGKKFKKFYTPLRKHQAKAELTRINSEFIKTSAKLKYPQSLLNCNFLAQNSQQFRELKNKIKQLQNKARNQYGLNFQRQSLLDRKKPHIWDDSEDNSEQKQNEEFDFSDLELGPILAKEFPLKYQGYNRRSLEKENKFDDTSIPKSLIDIVQNKGESYHQLGMGNGKLASSMGQNRGKLKKGYLHRPKSFKPTFTYIQI